MTSDKPSILITGASGFVGHHMAAHLIERGYRVVGLDVSGVDMPEGVERLPLDLGDPVALLQLPKQWYGVIHLAAASIPSLFATTAPILTNLKITLNLFDHLESARVLLVSSCHVYAPSERPRQEGDELVPLGRYGLSKHLCEQIVPHYQHKLDIRIARPFNHLGPGQRPELVIPSLMRRLRRQSKNDPRPILMKGMNSVRDFIDVRDVVAAYLAILELEQPGHRIFNVCTGQGHTIGSIAEEVLALLKAHRTVKFEDRPNSSDDIPYVVGDPVRLKTATGWAPRISLSDSLLDMLQFLKLTKVH